MSRAAAGGDADERYITREDDEEGRMRKEVKEREGKKREGIKEKY